MASRTNRFVWANERKKKSAVQKSDRKSAQNALKEQTDALKERPREAIDREQRAHTLGRAKAAVCAGASSLVARARAEHARTANAENPRSAVRPWTS